MPLALVGLYYLNGGRLDSFSTGDLLIIGCAVVLGPPDPPHRHRLQGDRPADLHLRRLLRRDRPRRPAPRSRPRDPDLAGLSAGWLQIAYAGILSTAVAFTFQAIAQQHLPPSNAAIINSSETLFAAIGGALLLGERLTPIGYVGAALMLVAIVAVEVVPPLTQRKSTAA